MKKRIAGITVCLVVIIAILTLPFPTPIHISFNGMDIENAEPSTIKIELKGIYFNYLLRTDKLKGHITLSPYMLDSSEDATFDSLGGAYPVLSLPGDHGAIHFCELIRYNEKLNRMTSATIFFDDKFERILIEDRTEDTVRKYISSSQKYPAADTLHFFETK